MGCSEFISDTFYLFSPWQNRCHLIEYLMSFVQIHNWYTDQVFGFHKRTSRLRTTDEVWCGKVKMIPNCVFSFFFFFVSFCIINMKASLFCTNSHPHDCRKRWPFQWSMAAAFMSFTSHQCCSWWGMILDIQRVALSPQINQLLLFSRARENHQGDLRLVGVIRTVL